MPLYIFNVFDDRHAPGTLSLCAGWSSGGVRSSDEVCFEPGTRHVGNIISRDRVAQCTMLHALQALAGISIIVVISLMLIFWTKMGRFAEPLEPV